MDMSPIIPAERIQLDAIAPKQTAALVRFMRASELDERLNSLVSTRASQINGCAFCLDMHWKDALAAGESKERLYSLDAWRESPLYEERERAALELCEAMTLVAEGHVPDEVWNRASAAFGEDELAHLVFAIAAINTANRLNITARLEPGHYEPGMLQAA
jgi:AhpD family alkylhydroperoxidase